MPGVAVVALDAAGGAQLGGGQGWFSVGGRLAVLLGDPVEPHPPFPPHTDGPPMATGSSWMAIDGAAVCRAGDVAACGHATSGRAWFQIA